MPYSSFTLAAVRKAFELKTVRAPGIFSHLGPVEPSAHLITALERKLPFAIAIGTEKAKSELIVADVLVELCVHFDNRVSLFSGTDFSVDDKAGLTGVCDFLVSLSPEQFDVEAPAIILVQAKKDALRAGVGQCAAEMVAAQRFNAEHGNDIPCIYGATTSGISWLFLKLEEKTLSIDMTVYPLAQCDKLLGILVSMVAQKA